MSDKAVLAGINQYWKISHLRGCVNDVNSMHRLLTQQFSFQEANVKQLINESVTKDELRREWEWLLDGASPGDRLVFHFSGHGSFQEDQDGDENDGVDELICLYDMDWNNPQSYLLDDELRAWTAEVPEGVYLTMILDSCHSGTGTRAIPAPRPRSRSGRSAHAECLVDVATSIIRADRRASVSSRSLPSVRVAMEGVADLLPDSVEKLGDESVLVRYVEPPKHVLERLARNGIRSRFVDRSSLPRLDRGAMDAAANMRHVLWAGSRSDQTSADAYIDGDFHGAFTYYFCDQARTHENSGLSDKVLQGLALKLKQEGFSQIPQLEPEGYTGRLFQGQAGTNITSGGQSGSGGAMGGMTAPSSEFWSQLLATMHSIQQAMALNSRYSASGNAGPATRGLVYVHGICQHHAGYSNPWWDSLKPYLPATLRSQLETNRHEVLWSEHVSPSVREGVRSATDQREMHALEQRLRDVLRDRAAQEVATAIRMAGVESGARMHGREANEPMPRALLGIPGLDCVDDFTKYLLFDRTRNAVLEEFYKKVRPMLASGQKIDVIAHSWGTVVAYEALRQLEGEGLSGRVSNFFTVGAALAISLIADRVRPNDGRKPTLVDRWVNLDASGDIVGGSLQAVGMAVDHEYLDLVPTGCEAKGWIFKIYAPSCAHSSYFQPSNTPVNRDIFAAFMQRT